LYEFSLQVPSVLEATVACVECPDEKPEKKKKFGTLDSTYQLVREAAEHPRGTDNECQGHRQRRGGRSA
jgi:hypothetical protein